MYILCKTLKFPQWALKYIFMSFATTLSMEMDSFIPGDIFNLVITEIELLQLMF